MAINLNVVALTGNLTRDPELRSTAGGTSVCKLGLAVNGRRKDQSGQWVDKPNFFDIVVFGHQAEACAQYLAKGRPVAVQGRLDWSSWEAQDGGKRSKVEVIADTVQFLNARSDGDGSSSSSSQFVPAGSADADFQGSDDDIPF